MTAINKCLHTRWMNDPSVQMYPWCMDCGLYKDTPLDGTEMKGEYIERLVKLRIQLGETGEQLEGEREAVQTLRDALICARGALRLVPYAAGSTLQSVIEGTLTQVEEALKHAGE